MKTGLNRISDRDFSDLVHVVAKVRLVDHCCRRAGVVHGLVVLVDQGLNNCLPKALLRGPIVALAVDYLTRRVL